MELAGADDMNSSPLSGLLFMSSAPANSIVFKRRSRVGARRGELRYNALDQVFQLVRVRSLRKKK